jgi:hypothetical protein
LQSIHSIQHYQPQPHLRTPRVKGLKHSIQFIQGVSTVTTGLEFRVGRLSLESLVSAVIKCQETCRISGMSRQHHTYLPNPNDLPANVPHPPSQPPYLTPIPLQPSFPTTGRFRSPAGNKDLLSPLSCYSDGRGSLSGLLSLIKTCCL